VVGLQQSRTVSPGEAVATTQLSAWASEASGRGKVDRVFEVEKGDNQTMGGR